MTVQLITMDSWFAATLAHISPGSTDLISDLDNRIRFDLQGLDDRLFFWVMASAFVVVIGCALEGPEILHELWPEVLTVLSGRWVKKVGLIGWLLVVLGVAGEGVFEMLQNRAAGQLQNFNEILLGDAQRQAGDARVSANGAADAASNAKKQTDAVEKQSDALKARMENASRQLGLLEMNIAAQGPRSKLLTKIAPELSRKLAAFAGQRVELFVCGQQGLVDQETLDTWGTIARILGPDAVSEFTGARWKEVPANLNYAMNCGAAKGLGQGVAVFVSSRASRNTMDAATLLGRGLAKALPPSPYKMPSLVDPDSARMMVERGFDKNAPWTVPAFDPDLITILIGEHP